MITIDYIESYITRLGFPVTLLAADDIKVLGHPERDAEDRLWMWYLHRTIDDLEVGLYEPESAEPAMRIKDRGVKRIHAAEFSLYDFPVFCMMLNDVLKVRQNR